jgi:hypothetical protein
MFKLETVSAAVTGQYGRCDCSRLGKYTRGPSVVSPLHGRLFSVWSAKFTISLYAHQHKSNDGLSVSTDAFK